MNCPKCDAPNAEDARFCNYCGNSLPKKEEKRVVVEVVSKTRWETCEIVWEESKKPGLFSGANDRFWALARGPVGEYVAGESPEFPGRPCYAIGIPLRMNQEDAMLVGGDSLSGKAHKVLVNQLLRDGWDHVTSRKDDIWYKDVFRRRVQSK